MAEVEQDNFAAAEADPVGSRLKAAREERGLSLDDVAAKTRVPIRHLQHMERGEWDALPAPTYSVGFARAYATAVGLNASEIGTELRTQLGAPKTPAMPAYYEPADPARVPPRSLAIVVFVVALALVAAYLVWRNNAVDDVDESVIAGLESPAGEAQNAPAKATPAAPAPAPAANGPVVLTAANDVWLRVYEGGGGPKLYENTLKAGDRYEVPATAKKPQILTGRPDALRVTVGSTPIPALGPAERTISDVSLLPADLLARTAPVQPAPVPGNPAPPKAKL